jgi:hypothetical protein
MPGRIPKLPYTNRYGFAKQLHSFCALFALSCPPMGEGGGGGNFAGREGGIESMK